MKKTFATGIVIIALGTILGLGACANTNTQSPIYKQSTLYKGSVPSASSTTTKAPISYETPNTVAVIYENDGQSEAAIYQTNSEELSNQNTESYGEQGTPGYYAMQNAEQTINYSFKQDAQIITSSSELTNEQNTNTIEAGYQTNTQSESLSYTVIAGDTLYSLARKNCTSVSELQRLNSVGNDFYIRAGDTIRIPATHCAK